MLHFPNLLGTVDETRYVLQDDEKPNTGNHYGERNFDAVISNESEKSKEQQSHSVANIPSFDNKGKTVNVDVWKGNTTFLSPKKENSGTNVA